MPRTLVTPEMRIKTKSLRRFATKGENLLWYHLRDLKSEGLKFRRQSPIGPYIADFVCFDPKIVVEIDGDRHETDDGKTHDANRDAYLHSSGYLVIRYDANDALDHAWHLAQDVKDKAGALPRLPHPRPSAGPSPQGGGKGARPPLTTVSRLARRNGRDSTAERAVPEETPVALSFAGTTHAVMMASPADLEDFALGFSLTEGIVARPDEIDSLAIEDHGAGIDIQITLRDAANKRFEARRRRLAGPVGCGLCGIESIEEALRSVTPVSDSALALDAADIARAVKLLSKVQPMHGETGAVHAAGFYVPGRGMVAAREDVGRHNALDKLVGALAKAGIDGASGAVVVTSRVSVEMVQKTAALGASAILAVSAPTALAIRTAEEAGMTLVALVRGEEYDVFTHPARIRTGETKHVA
jgi:FdhD protein